MQRLADQVPPLRRHVVIHLAEDHDKLTLDVFCALQRVVAFARAQRRTVHVGREVAYRRYDARVESAAVRKVTAETHS